MFSTICACWRRARGLRRHRASIETTTAQETESHVLGVVIMFLKKLAIRSCDRATQYGCRLAPTRVQTLLAMEVQTKETWTTTNMA